MSDAHGELTKLVQRDQAAIACPYPIFEQLRAESPIVWHEELGAWVATRYDDVREILRDTEQWSSVSPTSPLGRASMLADAMAQLMTEPGMPELAAAAMGDRRNAAVLLNADPPQHVRQRKAVNRAFRPGRIRSMQADVQALSESLVSSFVDRGSVEFVAEYAVPLPMTIIAGALGVGDSDLQQFKDWSDDLVMPVGNSSPSPDQVRDFLTSTKEFGDFMSELLDERAVNPTDDIISDVATAEVDGATLTEAEKISMLTQFLVAGNETTTKMITNIAFHLATNPQLFERVRSDRSLVDGVVEEALRYEAPVGGLFRLAKTDVTMGDVAIAKGESVWVIYAAANRDPERFACPNDFDPGRADVREHLAFGHGEHFCIGAGLARMEGVVATNAILDHLPDLRLSDQHVESFEDSFVLRGMKSLHLEFAT